MEAKRAAAELAVEYIQDGMVVGLGTGSTAYWAIQSIGRKVKDGLNIIAAATSIQSEQLAQELGIPLVPISELSGIDLTIDGADEIDDEWNLIKGGGGALLREKITASFSKALIIIADHTKKVSTLGRFPLPVEVVPFGRNVTEQQLSALGCTPRIRMAGAQPFVTDNGNYIIDCDFGRIDRPGELHSAINRIPGVVENGLFVNMAAKVIIGHPDGTAEELQRG